MEGVDPREWLEAEEAWRAGDNGEGGTHLHGNQKAGAWGKGGIWEVKSGRGEEGLGQMVQEQLE